MIQNKVGKYLLYATIIFWSAHSIGMHFELYWIFPWIDIVAHFLGGAWVAFFAIWYFYYSGRFSISESSKIFAFLIILGFTALAGIFWEFYELLFDQLIAKKNYMDLSQPGVIDTMEDFFFDLLGGSMSAFIFLIKRKKKKL